MANFENQNNGPSGSEFYLAPSEGQSGSEFSLAPSEGQSGAENFLALVRESAKLLKGFVAPPDFVPDAPQSLPPPTPEMLRRLSAPSLTDFYALALGLGLGRSPEKPVPALPLFPQGPESIKSAQTALEREIVRLKSALLKNAPGREKNAKLLDTYLAGRERLASVARLWPKIKKEALKWPRDAENFRQKALRMDSVLGPVFRLLNAPEDLDDQEDMDAPPPPRNRRASLTLAASALKKEVDAARAISSEKTRLSAGLSALSGDLSALLAAAGQNSDDKRDWAAVTREAETRLEKLKKEAARLDGAEKTSRKDLEEALDFLAETESALNRPDGKIMRDRLEASLNGVSALLASAHDRRRRLALIYFGVPPRLGRPIFLEKTHLVAAGALGRAQSLLEDLSHRLRLAMSKISSTHQLRLEGLAALESFSAPDESEPLLAQAESRLRSLGRAAKQKETMRRLLSQNAETETELSRSRLDNERLTRRLKSVALESEHLSEELLRARRNLSEVGRFKARLLKVYGQKNLLLKEAESSRRRLLAENAEMRAAKAELKRKRARLAAMYKLENDDLKRLSRDFGRQKDEMAATGELLAAREEELKANRERLESMRQERETLAAGQRELEAKASELADRLADSDARVESLSAETGRLGEKLAQASRARQLLGERLASSRGKIDLLARAQAALKKNLARQLSRAEKAEGLLAAAGKEHAEQRAAAREELEARQAKLTRQTKSILRLVKVRQALRADLGRARLRLSDLEKEKAELFGQLAAAGQQLTASEKTGEMLKNRLRGLGSENTRLTAQAGELKGEVLNLTETNLGLSARLSETEDKKAALALRLKKIEHAFEKDLSPFIKIMGEALWRSEASRKNSARALEDFKTQSGLMMEEARFTGDLREANIRLRAAARELDLSEAAQKKARELSKSLDEKDRELMAAQARADELESQFEAFRNDGDTLQHDRNYSLALTRMDLKNRGLRRALDLMKQRYGGRLDEARATEEGLRDLIDSQNRELSRQKRRLAEMGPLLTHFLEQAQDAAGDPELLERMKEEALSLSVSSGAPAVTLNAALLARLAELQPLVAFLAKSFVGGAAELAQARTERAALARDLEEAQASRKILQENLESRQGEFYEMREEAFRLNAERDQLQSDLEARDGEVRLLKQELAASDRDLAENDGRLEAAWAALNYMKTRSDDAAARMRIRLEEQARHRDKLNLEIQEKSGRISDLEERQNKLALLYWTLAANAAASVGGQKNPGAGIFDSPPEKNSGAGIIELPAEENSGAGIIGSPPEENQENGIIELPAEPLPAAVSSEASGRGGRMSHELLDMARKAARRGLFTLVLAGGLIMGGPSPAQALLEASPDNSPTGDFLLAPPENSTLNASLDSSFLGRRVSLDFVESRVRLEGRAAVESLLKEKVTALAQAHSLSGPEFMRLMRLARGPEDIVRLTDFEGSGGLKSLLSRLCPRLAARLAGKPNDLRDFLRAASSFKPEEGLFWERLYFNLAEKLDDENSLAVLAKLLRRKEEAAHTVSPEFAGRLAPFPEVDNMGPASFIAFMAAHIKRHWPFAGGRGQSASARLMAGDLYFAARAHRLPPSLLAAALEWEIAEKGLPALMDPKMARRMAAVFMYKKAGELAEAALKGGETWQEGRAPLCDLDEVLTEKYGTLAAENIYRRKMKIVMSRNKMIAQSRDLFSGSRYRRDI